MFNALFTKTDEYARLAQALGDPGACALFGIPGSGRAMVYAALAKALDKPLCIVTPGEAEATRFAGDLNALGVAAAVFPARDYVLRPIEGTGREYEYRRLAVLGDLVGGRLQAVCVPDEGLTQYTTPRADFCANTRSLRPGDTLPRAELTALLYGAGYTRRDQVDGPGQFSIRGDIADIYAPDMKQPARMEFWGDEIDTMHTFDLATQRRDEPIEKIYVSPAREILFGQPADAAEKIRSYIKKARGRRRTALETCTAADLAQLDGGVMPVNMDKYLTLHYPEPATILDYFDDPLLILEEPASLREAERATAFRRGEELSAAYGYGKQTVTFMMKEKEEKPEPGPEEPSISVPTTAPRIEKKTNYSGNTYYELKFDEADRAWVSKVSGIVRDSNVTYSQKGSLDDIKFGNTYYLDEKAGIVAISFPSELWETTYTVVISSAQSVALTLEVNIPGFSGSPSVAIKTADS